MSIEPTSFTQASQSTHWRAAMNDEYDALMRNQTWSLVPATSCVNIVGASGSSKLNGKQMARLTDIRLALLPRDSIKKKVLIMKKNLVR
ncbi:hypothetical protein L3X38_032657 [Prunus dulcis]|uniref:Uncharacterized protein n=1 Tax=Prunus dulcis TaxID=3755 RepID=A0AAD4VEJ2_PRUDU|nr:hypothetical protein L3X38_032657 [Prunus dulcis]